MNNDQHTKYTHIIQQVLSRAGRPALNEHVSRMGPEEWMKTSTKIRNVIPILGEAFQPMAKFLKKAEDSYEDWHHGPMWGHSRTHKLFPFYPADIATLRTLQITTVSRIFETHLSEGIDKTISPDLLNSLQAYPSLRYKL
jgi:hypothetical protein